MGVEATHEYRWLFEVAVQLFEAVVGVLAPGRSGVDVRAAADPILEQADMWTMDTLVHGWGLSIEPPRLDVTGRALIDRPRQSFEFSPGMAMVVQPHVLSPDRTRGLQVGSLVVIDGAEVLQRHPMEFALLEGDPDRIPGNAGDREARSGGGNPEGGEAPRMDTGGST